MRVLAPLGPAGLKNVKNSMLFTRFLALYIGIPVNGESLYLHLWCGLTIWQEVGLLKRTGTVQESTSQVLNRVTSPKGAKTIIFLYFLMVLRVRDHVQGLLQALKFNFPSKMPDLDAYVLSYATFRCF